MTVMLIAADVVERPAPSVALAVIECVPAAKEAVREYGAVVSVPIRLAPSKNSTLAKLTSSDAFALKVIVSVVRNVAPSEGAVTETVGA